MSFQVTTVSTDRIGFGEGPIWDERSKKLTFVDLFGKSIGMLDPKTQVLSQKGIPNLEGVPFISVAMPCANSAGDEASENFLVAAAGKLIKYNWESEKTKILFDFENKEAERKKLFFNDGKCDVKGRLWIGSFLISGLGCEPNAGYVSRFENIDGQLTETIHDSKYDLSNGLAWNKENTKLFFVDIAKKIVNIYDFDAEEGTLGNPRVFFDFNKNKDIKGDPDGMVTDELGNLWIACFKGRSVVKIDGSTGQLLETVKFPVENITSLCFGGDNYESLYVTTTSLNTNGSVVEGQPDSGKIFCVTAPKDNSFKGFQHYYANI